VETKLLVIAMGTDRAERSRIQREEKNSFLDEHMEKFVHG
jgi:hypothetical protein